MGMKKKTREIQNTKKKQKILEKRNQATLKLLSCSELQQQLTQQQQQQQQGAQQQRPMNFTERNQRGGPRLLQVLRCGVWQVRCNKIQLFVVAPLLHMQRLQFA